MQSRINKAIIALLIALTIYTVGFFALFNIFGRPARIQELWLGPSLRYSPDALDLGDFVFEHANYIEYRLYYPLCITWLKINGIRPIGRN